MVDLKTMAVSNTVGAAALAVPKVKTDLKPGTYRYDARLALGNRQMELRVSTAIQDGGSAWKAVEYTDGPLGATLETATIEKGSLRLRKRSVKRGPVAIHVEFSSAEAIGTQNMKGQDEPFSVDLDGPLFADSAGAYLVIGCLPLAPGYATAFRNFDLKKQQSKLMQIHVAGLERVTVPAGTFEAFKVELSSADGGPDKSTVWIAQDTRAPVKVSRVVPEVSGATIIAELLP
jgi:hypothetical protein